MSDGDPPADSGGLIVGRKQTLKAVSAGYAKVVFIARDAEKCITEDIRCLCLQKKIELKDVDTMRQLGEQCGLKIGAAVAAIVQ